MLPWARNLWYAYAREPSRESLWRRGFIRQNTKNKETKLWQRNYYEHIIREENVPHPQLLLNEINKYLEYKKFWVKFDIKDEKLKNDRINILKEKLERLKNSQFKEWIFLYLN